MAGPTPNNVTPFQRRVYDTVCLVPAGRVTTYGELGRVIGCGAPRAVGQALRRNPFAPDVPCHRVIAANGTIGGFNGQWTGTELERKRRLLAAEGVRFGKDGKLMDPARIFRFAETA